MERRDIGRAARLLALVLAVLALPAAAQAATAPGVRTGGSTAITQSSARLTGTVDPNGAETKYTFQYGTTSAYGATTPEAKLTGDGGKTVTADITGLAPATIYHYRLIAHNSAGLTKGADRTFKTRVQPLGVTFAGVPNPVPFGGVTTLSGQLTGTGNSGQQVVLQSNPFPYTQGFKNTGNPLVTDAQGNFSFGLVSVPLNTQFRVQMPEKKSVISPIVVVSVQAIVSTHVGATRIHKGSRLTFSGTVRPGVDGAGIAIQKKHDGRWVTVAGTIAHHRSSTSSRYSKRVRIVRGGTYRVYVGVADGRYVPNAGREITIHTK